MKTRTKGNIIIEEIKIGDIHYEFEYGMAVKCVVETLPILNNDCYEWTSKNLNTDATIKYNININYPHYSVNLYDYEAYRGCIYI
mgnify:CR=1 FL=1